MKDSVTYQAIVEEGMVKARQDDLLRLGSKKFGAPAAAAEQSLRGITDPERLARLMDRLLDVSSWHDFLTVP